MGSRFAFRWLTGLLMVAMLAVVGVYTSNLGVAHGIAESGRVIAAPGTGVPVVAVWPRPCGFGFGFFPFFPFLFILFWFFVAARAILAWSVAGPDARMRRCLARV